MKKSVSYQFARLKSAEKALQRQSLNAFPADSLKAKLAQEEYWKKRGEFELRLKEFLQQPFHLLTKQSLMDFISMCSAYRPVQPFQVLNYISVRAEELQKYNKATKFPHKDTAKSLLENVDNFND